METITDKKKTDIKRPPSLIFDFGVVFSCFYKAYQATHFVNDARPACTVSGRFIVHRTYVKKPVNIHVAVAATTFIRHKMDKHLVVHH